MKEPDRKLTLADEHLTGPVEPYEFVAEAGDVLFIHHLVYHAASPSHSPGRKPRLGLHAESFRKEWLTSIDPDASDLSPWHRSLALNGYYEARDEAVLQRARRKRHIEQIEAEKGIRIEDKWKRYSDWPTPPAVWG